MPSKKNSKVTLQDIADALNISRGTVDRAIHNRGRISEKTRKAILDKASAMGYIDDKISRFTILKDKIRILALFPEHPSFFYDVMKAGLLSAVTEQNDPLIELDVVHYNPEDSSGFIKILKSELQENSLKGVLLVPSGHFDPSLTLPGAAGIPYITINTDLPGSRRRCFVGQNLYQSGRLGGELIQKISPSGDVLVLSGYRGLWAHEQRISGVMDVLKGMNPEQKTVLRYCYDDADTAARQLSDALYSDSSIQGVISLTAAASLGAVQALRTLKGEKRIPLVGYDYNEELSRALDEGLCDALIGQNPEKQGSDAFKILYAMIQSGLSPVREHYVTATELFFRELKPVQSLLSDFLK
ncbi:MAG: LacI family DNA-binding transcriptional regulator [Spirochaetales bacterium]|nr:LacI family DNA-binding transcriptional regulator [Spirochaetales bacterium]